MHMIGAVLPVPASVLSLGAGVIFGLALGVLLVWSGATIGLIGCLFVGRCSPDFKSSHCPTFSNGMS